MPVERKPLFRAEITAPRAAALALEETAFAQAKEILGRWAQLLDSPGGAAQKEGLQGFPARIPQPAVGAAYPARSHLLFTTNDRRPPGRSRSRPRSKTGLNEAFLIDSATRDRLVAEDPRAADILKPYLRGQDVGRWRPEWAGLWMIFTRQKENLVVGEGAGPVHRRLHALAVLAAALERSSRTPPPPSRPRPSPSRPQRSRPAPGTRRRAGRRTPGLT
jgi:hypothetical protein